MSPLAVAIGLPIVWTLVLALICRWFFSVSERRDDEFTGDTDLSGQHRAGDFWGW